MMIAAKSEHSPRNVALASCPHATNVHASAAKQAMSQTIFNGFIIVSFI
jgi:hypothetical protein